MTKEKFLAYESVRQSGIINMFAVDGVCDWSGLSRSEVLDIMDNYAEYASEYLES